MCLERLQLLARTSAICDLTFSLVCILESGFIPTPMIYLKILRVLRRWLLSVADSAWQIWQRRRSKKCALIKALTIYMLMLSERVKACLSNQRFQESDCIRLDWRLVLVHQASPRLPKINLGSFMRLLILSSVLSISALIRKASAPTPRWRPSWLKLLWWRL